MDLDTLNHCISMDDWAGAICIVLDCHMEGSVKDGLQFIDKDDYVIAHMNVNEIGYYGWMNNCKIQSRGYAIENRIEVLQQMYLKATHNDI